MSRYFWNVMIWLSQGINTILLLGDPDETTSSRAWKNRTRPGWRQLSALLEWIDPGHGARAYEPDEGKRQVWKD